MSMSTPNPHPSIHPYTASSRFENANTFFPTNSEADDDAEPNGFKSDNEDNGSDAMDEETPRKKSKANTTAKDKIADKDFAKVKREEMENGSFTDNNNGYGNPFGGDGSVEMADYA